MIDGGGWEAAILTNLQQAANKSLFNRVVSAVTQLEASYPVKSTSQLLELFITTNNNSLKEVAFVLVS